MITKYDAEWIGPRPAGIIASGIKRDLVLQPDTLGRGAALRDGRGHGEAAACLKFLLLGRGQAREEQGMSALYRLTAIILISHLTAG